LFKFKALTLNFPTELDISCYGKQYITGITRVVWTLCIKIRENFDELNDSQLL